MALFYDRRCPAANKIQPRDNGRSDHVDGDALSAPRAFEVRRDHAQYRDGSRYLSAAGGLQDAYVDKHILICIFNLCFRKIHGLRFVYPLCKMYKRRFLRDDSDA